jgi:hypothetical protein
MVIRDEKPTNWFEVSPNIRRAMDESSLRELKESKLTSGLQGADGTLMHVPHLQGQLDGIPFAKSDGV